MANNTGKKFGGRQAGTPNKATLTARESIAAFVEGNVDRLHGWLDSIANGVPKTTIEAPDGTKTVTDWLVRPDPKAAYDAFMSVVEYHIPKLARTETKIEGEITHRGLVIERRKD